MAIHIWGIGLDRRIGNGLRPGTHRAGETVYSRLIPMFIPVDFGSAVVSIIFPVFLDAALMRAFESIHVLHEYM